MPVVFIIGEKDADSATAYGIYTTNKIKNIEIDRLRMIK